MWSGLIAVCLWLSSLALAYGQEDKSALDISQLARWLSTFPQENADTQKPASPVIVQKLNDLNSWIKSPNDIRLFRNWEDDDKAVAALVPFAAGRFTETRLPATYILGNVVDNTNVCLVLAYLKQNEALDPNGRYNLLQVVLQVASYAFDDVAPWIDTTMDDLDKKISTRSDSDKTLALIRLIKTSVATKKLGNGDLLSYLSKGRYEKCVSQLGSPTPYAASDYVFPTTANELDVETIRDTMFSGQRRNFSDQIVENFPNSPDKTEIAHQLVQAIIPTKQDAARRYRVNLYIALTFSRLPANSLADEGDRKSLSQLAYATEMLDPTFAENVRAALRRQNIASE